MKSSPKLRPNGWDALAAAAVLALAVACAALFWTGGEEIGPLTAVVSANGEPVDRVVLADLSGPEERTYTSNGYTLRVAFGPESAQVTVSDCPTQDCVHTGRFTAPWMTLTTPESFSPCLATSPARIPSCHFCP